MKRFILFVLCIMTFGFLLTGCRKDMNEEEVLKYLENRYHQKFTFVSSGNTRSTELENYPDEFSETNPDCNFDIYMDENGLKFHVNHYFRRGVTGSWLITDDYCVHLLVSQPELYEPLKSSEFELKHFNNIGMDEYRYAGFYVTVPDYEDIKPISELVFDVVQNDEAVLPDYGIIDNDEFYQMSIIPAIYLVTENGLELGKLKFRTNQIPQITDKEDFIRIAENTYIKYVQDGRINENIPDELKNRNDSDKIPVYADGKQVAFLEREFWDWGYTVQDAVPLHEEMEFEQLRTLCELAGYTVTPMGDKLRIEKDNDRITIRRTKGKAYNYSDFSVYKNAELFIPEGKIDNVLQEDVCSLTIADYYYLFGIKITVDYENEKAVIETDG